MSLIGFGKSKDDGDRTIYADFKNGAMGLFYSILIVKELAGLESSFSLAKVVFLSELAEFLYYSMMFFY